MDTVELDQLSLNFQSSVKDAFTPPIPLRPTSYNRLIGISGHARVGKDEVAKILADFGFESITLADPIRKALYMLNPLVASNSYGGMSTLRRLIDKDGWDEAKVNNREVRRLLQVFGSEVGREMFGRNVWVDLAKKKIGPLGRYVITDVRFQNEADAVLSLGGLLLKITRPGFGPVNGHPSDSGLPDKLFDSIVDNNGSLNQLRRKVLVAARLVNP